MSEISNIDDLKELPIVQDGKNIWQNRFHRHDVFQHTVEVVKILKEMDESDELLASGWWLHDVGKPPTKVPIIKKGKQIFHSVNGQPYHAFPDHEVKGKEMVQELPSCIFDNLNLNQERIARIVGSHFKPMAFVKSVKSNPDFSFFKKHLNNLSNDLDKSDLRHEILTIFYADKKSQEPEDLEFLFDLREYLLVEKGDLESLFNKFKTTYKR